MAAGVLTPIGCEKELSALGTVRGDWSDTFGETLVAGPQAARDRAGDGLASHKKGILADGADMVETLEVHFDALALDGVVTIALDFRGVWIVGSDGVRLFLGAVDIPEHIKTRLRRRLT